MRTLIGTTQDQTGWSVTRLVETALRAKKTQARRRERELQASLERMAALTTR
jgi:hypothetical protein